MNTQSAAVAKLNTIQAEAIYKVRMAQYGEGEFQPTEIFSRDSASHSKLRSTVKALAKAGVFGTTDRDDTLLVTEATIDAYNAWYKAEGWKKDYGHWRDE